MYSRHSKKSKITAVPTRVVLHGDAIGWKL